jgi:hypothetical protein
MEKVIGVEWNILFICSFNLSFYLLCNSRGRLVDPKTKVWGMKGVIWTVSRGNWKST